MSYMKEVRMRGSRAKPFKYRLMVAMFFLCQVNNVVMPINVTMCALPRRVSRISLRNLSHFYVLITHIKFLLLISIKFFQVLEDLDILVLL